MDQLEFTRAEAVAAIKAQPRGTYFYIFARADAPIAGEPNRVFPGVLSVGIPITRKAAVGLVDKLLSVRLEERGARLPCSVYMSEDDPAYRAFYLL